MRYQIGIAIEVIGVCILPDAINNIIYGDKHVLNHWNYINLNFHLLEVVSSYRDPQRQWQLLYMCFISNQIFANIDV